MPYINQKHRRALDWAIREMALSICRLPVAVLDGALNYVIIRLILRCYGVPKYSNFVRMLGTLEAVKLELYRRLIGPYEDKKKDEEGDIDGL